MRFGIQLFGVLEHTRKDFRREGEKLIPAAVGRGEVDMTACFSSRGPWACPRSWIRTNLTATR